MCRLSKYVNVKDLATFMNVQFFFGMIYSNLIFENTSKIDAKKI